MEIELDKKILKEKHYAINRIMNVTVNQEILNMEKMIDGLHTKLRLVEKTFEKDDVAELSKRWSELLLETQAFVDYFFESYRDISKNDPIQILRSLLTTYYFSKGSCSSPIRKTRYGTRNRKSSKSPRTRRTRFAEEN